MQKRLLSGGTISNGQTGKRSSSSVGPGEFASRHSWKLESLLEEKREIHSIYPLLLRASKKVPAPPSAGMNGIVEGSFSLSLHLIALACYRRDHTTSFPEQEGKK